MVYVCMHESTHDMMHSIDNSVITSGIFNFSDVQIPWKEINAVCVSFSMILDCSVHILSDHKA